MLLSLAVVGVLVQLLQPWAHLGPGQAPDESFCSLSSANMQHKSCTELSLTSAHVGSAESSWDKQSYGALCTDLGYIYGMDLKGPYTDRSRQKGSSSVRVHFRGCCI